MREQNQNEKFAYLDQMSTQELEALIRADVDSPEIQNDEAIFHILEVLNERAKHDPDAVTFDEDALWHDIQTIYHVPEGKGRALYPEGDEDGGGRREEDQVLPFAPRPAETKKRPRIKWALAVAAAAVIVFSAGMVGAQATGFDVFGFLAQWTADVFHYKTDSEFYPMVQEVFDQNHIPVELAPKWYPEGFEMGEPEVVETEFFTAVSIPFDNQKDNKCFSIQIRRYSSKNEVTTLDLQWELNSQQEYSSGDKTFFIISNDSYTTATWSDQEKYMMTIIGDLSVQETKKIIDSIGG